MTKDPHTEQMIEELFDQAARLPAAQRQAYLDANCSDASVRKEVLSLLAHDDAAPVSFLRRSPLNLDDASHSTRFLAGTEHNHVSDDLEVPHKIGRYSVVRKIGEGGMGIVFEAIQEQPRRHVAVKLVRPGMSYQQIRRRFEREAQFLGQLRHPCIAQIFEAGIGEVVTQGGTSSQQPFFAMELLRGSPIDRFAREHQLTVRQRLALFARVCDAVDHAHKQGIIHRDLKPANIIVDHDGNPKVLDFGIARLTNADVHAVTMHTEVGQLVGTIPYMSPEQVAGDSRDMDARADIYSLGVILFELLAEKLPLDLKNKSIPEAVRIIREDEPSQLSELQSSFRGDLDTIVTKALEKDRERRYQTAADFAADIRRHLNDEPIFARPASKLYYWRKFARRNKALVGGLIATMLALLIGAAASLRFAIKVDEQRARADRQAYRATLIAASSALRERDVGDAEQHLASAPTYLRGWEWDYYQNQLDESLFTIRPTLEIKDSDELHFSLVTEGQVLAVVPFPNLRLTTEPLNLAVEYWNLTTRTRIRERTINDCIPLYLKNRTLVYENGAGDHVLQDFVTGAETSLAFQIPRIEVDGVKYAAVTDISHDGETVLYNTLSGPVLVRSGSRHEFLLGNPVERCLLSPDGQFVIANRAAEFHVWSTDTNQRTDRRFPSAIGSLAIDPSSQFVAIGDFDGSIHVHTLKNQTWTWNQLRIGRVWVSSLAFSDDGRYLAAGSHDGLVRLIDFESGRIIASFMGHVPKGIHSVAFSDDGKSLISASKDKTIRVWDPTMREDPRVLRGHEASIYPVALSPSNAWLASGSWDGTLRLWDTASSELIATLKFPEDTTVVHDLAWSPNGEHIAAVVWGIVSNIYIIDSQTLSVLKVLPGEAWFERAAFAPDGAAFAVATKTDIRLFDTDTFDRQATLPGSYSVTFSPDGRFMATSESELTGTVLLVETASGRIIHSLKGHAPRLARTAFSGDGKLLASVGDDRTVRIWDVQTGRNLQLLSGHSGPVYGVAFAPNGNRLATGSDDRTIRVWDTKTWDEVAQLRGHEDLVWSLSWSSDGRSLFSGSGDSTIRVWEAQPLSNRLRSGPAIDPSKLEK